jgi:glycosyltransferase involved in cell wall biosynthesis
MNILVITTLYPNTIQFRHGVFVETRIKDLLKNKQITAEVIAPVPWFPIKSNWFSHYSQYAEIPRYEVRSSIKIYHPRYLVIPKIGMLLTPLFLSGSVLLCIRKLKKKGFEYDLIDGHYFYPDGVAVAILGKLLNKPFTITARGTDINLIADYYLPRKMILWAANSANACITVCKALKDRIIEIGIDKNKVHVLRNGVDLQLFRPLNREKCRKKYDLTRKTLVSVGHLIERKGHGLIIDAMDQLTDYELIIVGGGELEKELSEKASKKGLSDRVYFLGERSQAELREIYNAVDALVLASSREGWANVLLESMACGTPVVATDIWGTPEVVQSPEAGVLIKERTASAIAEGVKWLFENYPSHQGTRKYAEQFSWEQTSNGLRKLFGRIIK